MNDIVVSRQWSIATVEPVTDAGRTWCAENLHVESWQRSGAEIMIDYRYLQNIVDGIEGDGLSVGGAS